MNTAIINNYQEIIDKEFHRIMPISSANYKTVVEAMQYSFLLGGKRIRPIILLEFFRICGGKENKALPFAIALEMIHTYSLIHDDLPCMDNDDMRRGKPSNHKIFGEDMALLAGDGLLTEAFYMASQCKNIPAESVLRAIGELSLLSGYRGMVGGQVIDLESEGKKISADIIEELNLLKTGGLLSAAAKIGAILAGADEECIGFADSYGKYLGLAFQIVDDILDYCGDEKLLGKPINSDEKNDKSTFVSIYGIEKCKKMVDEYTKSALDCLKSIGGDSTFLRELTVYLANRKY